MPENDHGTLTEFGFTWGPMEVSRTALLEVGDRASRVVTVKSEHGSVDVYVSRTGRSIRVFRDGKELKEAANG